MDPESLPPPPPTVHLEPGDLEILYQDDSLVAIHKPAGLQVHRTPADSPDDGPPALQLLRDQLGRYVFPCHRLDRPTSGILVFALDKDSSRILSRAFEAREVEKFYLALVRGWPDPPAALIDHPLKPQGLNFSEKPGSPPKPATTHYRTLAKTELDIPVGPYDTARYALLEARPLTGRMHQIRRHLKHIHHPILGDTRYGDGAHNQAMREAFAVLRLQLASVRLVFRHPKDPCRTLDLCCPPAGDILRLIDQFDWTSAMPPEYQRPEQQS